MALVAIGAVVDITADIRVLEIVCIISAVAARTLKNCVVIRVDVASGADVIGVAMTGRERGVLRVVKRGARPCRGVVAGLARSGEKLRLRRVARIGGVVVVGLVAADASG